MSGLTLKISHTPACDPANRLADRQINSNRHTPLSGLFMQANATNGVIVSSSQTQIAVLVSDTSIDIMTGRSADKRSSSEQLLRGKIADTTVVIHAAIQRAARTAEPLPAVRMLTYAR